MIDWIFPPPFSHTRDPRVMGCRFLRHRAQCLPVLNQEYLLSAPPETARAFLKRRKMGQYDKEKMEKKEVEEEKKLAEQKALAEAISVGSRCEVRTTGQPSKRGTVMYVGE